MRLECLRSSLKLRSLNSSINRFLNQNLPVLVESRSLVVKDTRFWSWRPRFKSARDYYITMNKLMNYIGQVRIYSLIDLALLLFVVSVGDVRLVLGGLLLHVAFLGYLECSHKHDYRYVWKNWAWVSLGLVGTYLYSNIAVIGFILMSFLYTKKNEWNMGYLSPFFRSMQLFFLVGGIIGYFNYLNIGAAVLLGFRNFLGDLRDVTKDRREKIRTLPVLIGMKRDINSIHLIGVLGTTFVWWSLSLLSFPILLIILLIEIGTYNLTAR